LENLTKTQVSVLVSYSMPFVLLLAIVINAILQNSGLSGTPYRLIFLSAAFPIGLSAGRAIYLRWSHVRISFDAISFSVTKGSKEIASGFWLSYNHVSILIDRYGRPNLRLYKSIDGDHADLPISKTNAMPQEFRNQVRRFLSTQRTQRITPQVAEAA
jgi:hypothetical protein